MRVWPSSFEGLRLSLPPGWYPLPAYTEGDERRRLLELIAAGVEDIAYVAEIEWGALDRLGPRLELGRTLALVRVPACVEAGDEIMRELRAKLGSVRVGLVQHEAPTDWPELAWQERQIKAPLLAWLRRQLHVAEHPLAGLDLRALPVDALASYTPEPVELLVMLEAVIDHRTRYFEGGATVEDWTRSIVQIAMERFASRFGAIAADQAAEALEFVIEHGEDSSASLAEGQVGARALAHVGLASIGGRDVLLGPLARFAGRRDNLPRLLALLPDQAWSPVSRRELGRAMPPLFMLPRAVLVAPEPHYSRWPAVLAPVPAVLQWLIEFAPYSGGPASISGLEWFRRLLCFEKPVMLASLAGARPAWADGVLTLLREIDDPRRLEHDVERGSFHRFDAIDREWAEAEHGPELRAYLRWIALSSLQGHARGAAALELIEGEVAHALGLGPSCETSAALHALCGDIRARQGRYAMALAAWERSASALESSESESWINRGQYRLSVRRTLAHLRLDQVDAASALGQLVAQSGRADSYKWGEPGAVVHDVCQQLLTLARIWAERLGVRSALEAADEADGRDGSPSAFPSLVTQAAVALELGDWPRALALSRVEMTLDTPEGARALLLSATIQGALGEVDGAASTIAAVRQRASETHDPLLLALSHRALASFPGGSRDPSEYVAALDAAIELERDLGLPDADLIELERASWALIGQRISGEQYEAALDRLSPAAIQSPSLAAASMRAQLRTIALFVMNGRAHGEVPSMLVDALAALVGKGVNAGEISPWFDRACEELISLARAKLAADEREQARSLIAAALELAGDDPRYLAELEHLELEHLEE